MMENADQIAAVLTGILRGNHVPAFAEFERQEKNIPQVRSFVTVGTYSENFGAPFCTTDGSSAVPVQVTLRLRLHAAGRCPLERIHTMWYDEILPVITGMQLQLTGLKMDAPFCDKMLGCIVREVRFTVDALWTFPAPEEVQK